MSSWLRQPPHQRRADVALALQLAQKPALFEVAERSVPSRIAEALAHVGRAGRAGVVLIDFSNDRKGSMKFGTIGAGAVALAFGREALARGHEVVLSSRRGPDALADKVAELGRVLPRPRSRKPRASSTCCSPCLGETSSQR